MIPPKDKRHHTRSVSDSQSRSPGWKVLVIDDDPSMHTIMDQTLGNIVFLDRPIHCLYADSCDQAKEILTATPDTALVLLVISVETDTDGLELIHWIRNTLQNSGVQIAFRTGKTQATFLKLQTLVKKAIQTFNLHSELKSELGLSVVHGIVARSNGAITINTQSGTQTGMGTKFTLFFPRHIPPKSRVSKPENTMIKGKANVLFIDDDPMLVDIGRMMLEKLGYKVMATQNALAGLDAVLPTPSIWAAFHRPSTGCFPWTGSPLWNKDPWAPENKPLVPLVCRRKS